jgi:hypothetical protein
MIKPPFTAKQGLSGIWIEDADNITVCDISLLIEPSEAFRVAEFLVKGANLLYERQEHARRIGRECGGRPPLKKPSKAALAKRESRKRLKQQKPE